MQPGNSNTTNFVPQQATPCVVMKRPPFINLGKNDVQSSSANNLPLRNNIFLQQQLPDPTPLASTEIQRSMFPNTSIGCTTNNFIYDVASLNNTANTLDPQNLAALSNQLNLQSSVEQEPPQLPHALNAPPSYDLTTLLKSLSLSDQEAPSLLNLINMQQPTSSLYNGAVKHTATVNVQPPETPMYLGEAWKPTSFPNCGVMANTNSFTGVKDKFAGYPGVETGSNRTNGDPTLRSTADTRNAGETEDWSQLNANAKLNLDQRNEATGDGEEKIQEVSLKELIACGTLLSQGFGGSVSNCTPDNGQTTVNLGGFGNQGEVNKIKSEVCPENLYNVAGNTKSMDIQELLRQQNLLWMLNKIAEATRNEQRLAASRPQNKMNSNNGDVTSMVRASGNTQSSRILYDRMQNSKNNLVAHRQAAKKSLNKCPQKKKEVEDCYHMTRKGWCRYGDTCKFGHPKPPQTPMQLFRRKYSQHLLSDKAPKKTKAKKKMVVETTPASSKQSLPTPVSLQTPALPVPLKTFEEFDICWEFNTSTGCPRGTLCKWRHVYLSNETRHPFTSEPFIPMGVKNVENYF